MIKIIDITQKDDEVLLYYAHDKNGKKFFKVITSSDGFQFDGKHKYIIVTDAKKREEQSYDWKSFKVAKEKDTYFVTYKINSRSYLNLNGASSSDLIRWTKTGKIENIKESGTVVPDYKHNSQYIMYFGEKVIRLASSSNLSRWKTDEKPVLEPRKESFDSGDLKAGTALHIHDQILLIYYVMNKNSYSIGAALFDKRDPHKVLWRSEKPLWEQPENLHKEPFSPLGVAIINDALVLYWLVGHTTVYAISCPLPTLNGLKDKTFSVLKKFEHNPIIKPSRQIWESRATFNSAAVYEDGKVHFVYRALGDSDLSVLGYATSKDGFTIDERSKEPIYIPRESFETPGNRVYKKLADHFVSGGGYGGVEDPRITKIDDKFYMTYVAFDGASPPRVALTSISVDNFLNRRWEKWEKPKLISAPGMVNKNAVILPEKINGKYAIFHRIYPNVLVDYVDDLNFENNQHLQGQYFIPPRKNHWDSKKVGAGAPPIKTKDGWLFIYQSVGYQDPGRYKIGAMMLDANDPTKVLYRANNPLVSPDEGYENAGHKAGVVYPCGAVVKDGKLIVYYGGADSVVCAASENLDTFLDTLKHNQEPKLRRVNSPVFN